MQRFALILSLLMAGVAFAQAPTDIAVGPSGATTQTANSAAGNKPVASTDGIALTNQCMLVVTVSADSGQTLSGGGSIVFHYRNTTLARWAENIEGTNPPMTAGSGLRDVTFFVREVFPGSADRVYVEARSVTVSSGSVTVRLRTVHCKTVH